MREYLFLLVTTLLCAAVSTAYAGAPASAKSCEACHGTDGVSTHEKIPTIAGVSAFYLEGQMQAYQKHQRPCEKVKFPNDASKPATDMCDIASKLSPDQIKEITAYFESLPFKAATQPVDPALVAKGKSIHDSDCDICHSEGGSEAMDDAGILAGQPKAYLITELTSYIDGKRLEPEKMKTKTSRLSPDDVKALADFYASEGNK
jgi:cytochrome c553